MINIFLFFKFYDLNFRKNLIISQIIQIADSDARDAEIVKIKRLQILISILVKGLNIAYYFIMIKNHYFIDF